MAASARPEPAAHPPQQPRTMRLYDTIQALDILDELIAEHGEFIEAHGGDIEAVPAIAELLAFAEEQFEEAVGRWGLKIRTLLAEAEPAKMEASRLGAIAKQKDNAATRLKDFLKRQLEGRHIPKVKTDLVTVRVQKNSQPTVRVVSAGALEELYAQGSPFVQEKKEYVINRDAVLGALERGETVPATILVETGTHLRVS